MLSVLLTGAFLFARWAVNAESLGAHDMGLAIGSAFAVAAGVYAAIALAVPVFLVGFSGWLRGWRTRPAWVALGIALVPLVVLWLGW